MELSNVKKELYAQFRSQGYNKKESAIKAGYSQKSAHTMAYNLEKDQDVLNRIKELRDEMFQDLGVDRLYLMRKVKHGLDVLERLMEDSTATPKDNRESAEKLVDKSLQLYKYLEDLKNGNSTNNDNINEFEKMTIEEINDIINEYKGG